MFYKKEMACILQHIIRPLISILVTLWFTLKNLRFTGLSRSGLGILY